MAREFKPNGGSTTRDDLDRIEKKLDTVERKIDNHIEWHLGE
jgi:tetrahydromethanopterin S-methyltransferase subunit G